VVTGRTSRVIRAWHPPSTGPAPCGTTGTTSGITIDSAVVATVVTIISAPSNSALCAIIPATNGEATDQDWA
jgi:hypothetical protein